MEVNGKNLNIQGGSPEDPGSLPEEAVQKEIEALAREAAARGIIEAARIEAGEALMKILEETPVKEKRSRETEDKEKADSAELSNESLAYNRRLRRKRTGRGSWSAFSQICGNFSRSGSPSRDLAWSRSFPS